MKQEVGSTAVGGQKSSANTVPLRARRTQSCLAGLGASWQPCRRVAVETHTKKGEVLRPFKVTALLTAPVDHPLAWRVSCRVLMGWVGQKQGPGCMTPWARRGVAGACGAQTGVHAARGAPH